MEIFDNQNPRSFFGIPLGEDAFVYLCKLVNDAYDKKDENSQLNLASFFVNSGFSKRANYLIEKTKNPDVGNIYKYLYSEEKKREALSFSPDVAFQEEQVHLDATLSDLSGRIDVDSSKIVDPGRIVFSGDEDEMSNWKSQNERNIRLQDEIDECKSIYQRPYFARVDVKNSQGETEKHYIGDTLYVSYDHDDIVIESPWSDYRDLFYHRESLKTMISGETYEVTLRRSIGIYEAKLNSVKELFNVDAVNNETAEATVTVTDPFLLRVLEEKRGESGISNIIRSIQTEQNEIIEAPYTTNLLVQGCAGSGKTMILLHRLSYLCYRNKNLDQKKICVVGPSTNYDAFFDGLAKELKIQDVKRTTINGLLFDIYQAYRSLNRVSNSNLDENSWLANTLLNREDRDLAAILYSPSFRVALKSECLALRQKDKQQSEQSDRLDLQMAQLKEDYPYSYEDQPEYFEIMKAKSLEKSLGNTIFTGSGTAGLEYIRRAAKRAFISKNGKYISAVRYAQVLFLSYLFGPLETSLFDFYCFDESQDYPYSYWLLLHSVLSEHGIFNFYGDLNQNVDSDGTDTWKGIANLFSCQKYQLSNNYRNSEEIISFYNQQLGTNDRSMGLKVQPVFVATKREFTAYLKMSLLFNNRTAVISNDPEFFGHFTDNCCVRGRCEKDKIALLSVQEAKGLEFDAVFVYAKGMSIKAKYVAMTRALSELYLVDLSSD